MKSNTVLLANRKVNENWQKNIVSLDYKTKATKQRLGLAATSKLKRPSQGSH